MRDGWLVIYLHLFFANDVDPWCSCQDNLDWDLVEVKVIALNGNNGELDWYWGNLRPEYDTSWRDFKYLFRVVKEDSKLKISYLQGFDFKESTRRYFQ